MNFSENKSFCVLPWINISVDPDGRIKPCCVSKDEIKKDDGTPFNLGYDTISEILNSSDFQTLRRKMHDGEMISGCSHCYNNEKYGAVSSRILHNKIWLDIPEVADKVKNHVESIPETVQYFDLRFGNLCNLKCRSCSPRNSSQLNKELFELKPKHDNLGQFFIPEDLDNINDWYTTDIFIENLQGQAPYIDSLYFTGGEPTLIDKNYEILDYFIRHDRAKNITLKFNTNLTNLKSKFLDTVMQFKKVIFMASIDGFGNMQEYLRYPSDWGQISSNLEKIATLNEDKVSIVCTPVIQKTNLSHLVDLFDYLNNINIKYNRSAIQIQPIILNHPAHLDLLYLPLEYKQKQLKKIKSWINEKYVFPTPGFTANMQLLENKCNADVDYIENLKKFKEFTDIFDNHRNHYLKDVNPELIELMNK